MISLQERTHARTKQAQYTHVSTFMHTHSHARTHTQYMHTHAHTHIHTNVLCASRVRTVKAAVRFQLPHTHMRNCTHTHIHVEACTVHARGLSTSCRTCTSTTSEQLLQVVLGCFCCKALTTAACWNASHTCIWQKASQQRGRHKIRFARSQ